jgi:protein-S-isoprenylcysteine O-methyltransferase Ste14
MAMIEELRDTGNWLFRWRGYLPIVLIAVVMIAMYLSKDNIIQNPWQWSVFCIFISSLGEAIRMYVVGHSPDNTSGRNTKKQIADVLNTSGAYSLMRHPLYFANFLMWLGLGLFTRMWWINVVFCLSYWLYYERIMFAEEAFLREKFGEAYLDYSKTTPPFLPVYWNRWQIPSLSFRWKKVFRKELSSFYAMIISFVILALYQNYLVLHTLILSRFWIIFFITGTLLYLVLRFLKKKTKVLAL